MILSRTLRFLLLGLVLLAGAPAHAATSQWLVSEGGRVRLTALPASSDGTVEALLDIDLKPGWKTYWLEPGASGIPPQISFADGTNLTRLHMPAPKLFDDGTVAYAGYDRPVAFTMTLKRLPETRAAPLSATIFLGICKDICIPVQGVLTLDPASDANVNPQERLAYTAAQQAMPAGPQPEFRVLTVGAPVDSTVRITLAVPPETTGDALNAFLAPPAGFAFGEPDIKRGAGNTADVVFKLLRTPKGTRLSGQEGRLIVTANGRAMETQLAFQ